MIDPADLRRHVIRPTLEKLGLYSPAAANLLLGTALTESTIGSATHLVQKGGGPARGIYQVEPATHNDIYDNFLAYRPELRHGVKSLLPLGWDMHEQLVTNLAYATAIARIKYLRAKPALPASDDLEALGGYWKQHYNTAVGAGTVEHWMSQVEPHRAAFLEGE